MKRIQKKWKRVCHYAERRIDYRRTLTGCGETIDVAHILTQDHATVTCQKCQKNRGRLVENTLMAPADLLAAAGDVIEIPVYRLSYVEGDPERVITVYAEDGTKMIFKAADLPTTVAAPINQRPASLPATPFQEGLTLMEVFRRERHENERTNRTHDHSTNDHPHR